MTSVYDGLILTTIKLDKEETLQDGTVILSFTNASENAGLGEAKFLTDIKEVEIEGEKKYMATPLTIEQARSKVEEDKRLPLFSLHGCCGDPDSRIFDDSKKGQSRFKNSKYYLIPVIWPTKGTKLSLFSLETWKLAPDLLTIVANGVNLFGWRPSSWISDEAEERAKENGGPRGAEQLGYKKDWETFAPEAGGILVQLVDSIKNGSFGPISLLCHSMGNHVVFNSANQLVFDDDKAGVKFQNIFLVGADIKNDSFSKNPSANNLKRKEEIKNQARGMAKMLANKGKIYVLHTEKDRALEASPFAYPERGERPRLGFTGAQEISDEFTDIVRNFDVTEKIEKLGTDDKLLYHEYMYDEWAVEFYNTR